MDRKSSMRRTSLLDVTRKNNYLRKSFNTLPDKDTLTREEYLTLLLNENRQWISILSKIKKSSAKKLPPVTLKDEYSIFLSSKDKPFLSDQPDYVNILNIANKYVSLLLYAEDLKKNSEDQYSFLSDALDENRDKIFDELTKVELCKICDDGYCTEDIHGLADRWLDVSF